jgi:Tol biopolymer transport system component
MHAVTLAILVVLATVCTAATSASARIPELTGRAQNGRIAFRRYLDVAKTTSAIFTVNPDGTKARQVTRPQRGVDDRRPDWSANAAKLAFERKLPCPAGGTKDGLNNTCDLVYTVRASGGKLRRLVPCRFKVGAGTGTPGTDCVGVDEPAWSRSGSRIAFQYNLVDRRYSGALGVDAGIWIVSSNGAGLHQVTQRVPGSAWDSGVSWAPNDHTLAFVRSDLAGDADAIFTVNVDGSDERQVTPWDLGGGDRTDWSQDGHWILFRVQSPDGASNLYKVHPYGTGLTNLTNQGPHGYQYLSASFSPDGARIASSRTPGAGAERAADLCVMNQDGSKTGAVMRTRRWESAADWGSRPK